MCTKVRRPLQNLEKTVVPISNLHSSEKIDMVHFTNSTFSRNGCSDRKTYGHARTCAHTM